MATGRTLYEERMLEVSKQLNYHIDAENSDIASSEYKELTNKINTLSHNKFVRFIWLTFLKTPLGEYVDCKIQLKKLGHYPDNPERKILAEKLAALEINIPAEEKIKDVREKCEFELLILFLPDPDYRLFFNMLFGLSPPLIQSLRKLAQIVEPLKMTHRKLIDRHKKVLDALHMLVTLNQVVYLTKLYHQVEDFKKLALELINIDSTHKELLDQIIKRLVSPTMKNDLDDLKQYEILAQFSDPEVKAGNKTHSEAKIAAAILKIMRQLSKGKNVPENIHYLRKIRSILSTLKMSENLKSMLLTANFIFFQLEADPKIVLLSEATESKIEIGKETIKEKMLDPSAPPTFNQSIGSFFSLPSYDQAIEVDEVKFHLSPLASKH